MPTNTYVALRTTTVGTAVASVTLDLTGISGYTDLVLVSSVKVSGAAEAIKVQFNGDTGNNYSYTQLIGDGSSAVSYRSSNVNYIYASNGTSTTNYGTGIFNIQNYSNTTTYKTVLGRFSEAEYNAWADVGVWRSTAAITSINLSVTGTSKTISSGSTFSLYGIAASTNSESTPKATGGYVSSDSTYWYHAFPYAGTFTPNQSLTCDYVVVAGGGGGGDNIGAGGGAGGYRTATNQSLTATGYTVTIGAGGSSAGGSGTSSSFNGLATTGGGGGGGAGAAGQTGGSGGGRGGASNGSGAAGNAGGYSPVEGFAGGAGVSGSPHRSGGGGGATAVGQDWQSSASGAGGAGSSSVSSWLLATGLGQNVSGTYYLAGGGGGGNQTPALGGAAGIGGGGIGGYNANGTAGQSATGGGGGGGGNNGSSGFVGGTGGSGLVIVRYAK
jgi:hypothetical protein